MNAFEWVDGEDVEIPWELKAFTDPLDDVNKFSPEYILIWAQIEGLNFLIKQLEKEKA